MQITDIKIFLCDAFRTNLAFVKVETDEGIWGYGESSMGQFEYAITGMIKDLRPKLLGRDPRDIEQIWHDANRDSYWRGGPVLSSALAGIEMACWDIKGKILGVPVWQLLGGRCRDEVPCYANAWFVGAKTPDEFAEKARLTVSSGWKALKWDPFGSLYRDISQKDFDKSVQCVSAVREAVGDEVDLMIECHGRFNMESAVRIASRLERYNILWLEEPLFPELQYTMAELRQRTTVPLATGERVYNRFQAMDLISGGCCDFIQPDISRVGIKEIRAIGAIAESAGIGFCPHNPMGPLTNAATMHIAVSTPNFFMLETMANDVPWRGEISDEEIYFKDGMMHIPEKPGLGIEINEAALEKYPAKPHPLRHYTGTLTEIRPENAGEWFSRKKREE